ncbi:MAG: aspartate aminotransferase family protein [Acidimicrobiales bacterium]|nr:aspartate aminotransferase family protein [Acidimicrobiales bacterium]
MTEQRARAQRHLVPHFTPRAAWRSDSLPIFERADGCYLYDTEGNEWLDGLAGLFCVNIGHGRTDLAEVAADQMGRLAYATNWGNAHPPSIEAASMIADLAPGDLSEVFFVSSGSEAVESALKFARNYHLSQGDEGRYKVIARNWAYHGTTLGALAVTGIPKFRDPFLPMLWDGARHVPNTRQCTSPAGTPVADLSCVRAVEEAILAEGPETVAVVIAEPVQNGGGALVPPDGYWQELRRICDRHGVLLVADEVICSFGRFGHWFASERMGVVPDLITFAKGVTSAYQPLGGVVIRGELVESVHDSPMGTYMHGSTFGGHPVATAVAVANMSAMRDEGLMEHVLANETGMAESLAKLADAHPCVKEVRGTGFFYAIDLCADREAGRELSPDQEAGLRGGALGGFVREQRMTIRPDDRGYTGLTISPPLIADATVVKDLVDRTDRVLERTGAWLSENA